MVTVSDSLNQVRFISSVSLLCLPTGHLSGQLYTTCIHFTNVRCGFEDGMECVRWGSTHAI